MSNYIGRTMEISGFWLTFEPRMICVRTSPDSHTKTLDLEFRFGDMRDDVMKYHIRVIGQAINLGACCRGNDIRRVIGTEYSPVRYKHCPADEVFNENSTRYEIVRNPYGYERKPWV